jgi:ESS family glutamate:Na+ symporter
MITLKIWQLYDLAVPMLILLGAQVIIMFLYARFAVFNVMGKDYDAAVITAGMCGFGLGVTANAMANMQTLCNRYVPSVKAYLLIPIVGTLFNDFFNSLIITLFINMV